MRKRTLIELLLLLPLLFIGIQVWQRGMNRERPSTAEEEENSPAEHRVQDLMRRTPAAPPTPAPGVPAAEPLLTESAEPELPAWITIQVLEADGSVPMDAVMVFSPDETLYESAPLGQLVLSADPGLLTLQASATDGETLRLSEAYTLRLESGGRHTIQIRLPRALPAEGAPGFSLLPGDVYALIADVLPGSPAQIAGLQPGDAVLSVDGVPTGSLTAGQLETLLFGPAREPLRLGLIVQHENGEFEEIDALIERIRLP
jgi:hypothetical protein